MRWMDYTHSEPAMNLALDEALLNEVEQGGSGNVLRFWESSRYFVVLGVAQRVDDHVDADACQADDVPITRRCSGGGCVLQGPGSLNFTVALRTEEDPDLQGIRSSYCRILGTVSKALATLGVDACHAGISDVAMGDIKVGGNAQKRRRNAILHHGTILHGLDLARISRYLREPEDRPDYRGERRHEQFVQNLDASEEELKKAVRDAFGATEQSAPTNVESAAAQKLAAERYSLESWTRRR
jgi:lipoate-protein ligase A